LERHAEFPKEILSHFPKPAVLAIKNALHFWGSKNMMFLRTLVQLCAEGVKVADQARSFFPFVIKFKNAC
jgi:hypothetical protein